MKGIRRYFTAVLAAFGLMLGLFAAAPVSASAEEIGSLITKVLATTSGTPVAMSSAANISAATSTAGCYVAGISWTDMSGQPIDTFTTDYAMVTITLGVQPGSYFADGLEVYLNNTAVDASVGGGGTYLTITRVYAPDVWAPTITKHPTSENVEEGELTSFVAAANGVDKSVWTLIDGSGTKYSMEELQKTYSQMTYSETFGKVILRNIPKELDNSKIYCTFSGSGGTVETNAAYLYVKSAAPSPTPSPSPTPTPSASPSPTPSASASPAPGDEAPADHEHSYGREWKFDGNSHWHECSICGARSDEATHSMTWTETEKATKKAPGEETGECSVCDYETTRELKYEKGASSGKWILYVGIGAVVLMVVLMVVSSINARRERQRRARERARRRRERGYDDWE